MKTKTITRYFVIKAKIEIPSGRNAEDAADEVASEADYNLSYDADGIRVVDTVLMGVTDNIRW